MMVIKLPDATTFIALVLCKVSSKLPLAWAITPISTYGGSQYEIFVSISKDPKTGNWLLSVDGEFVGYWPKTVYKALSDGGANRADWGGEVCCGYLGSSSLPQMGSGHFPSEGDGKACLVFEIQIITKMGGSFVDFGTVTPFQSAPQCYKILEGILGGQNKTTPLDDLALDHLSHNGLGSVKTKWQSLEVVFLEGKLLEVVGNMGQLENLMAALVGAVSLVLVTARFGPGLGGYSEACSGSKLTAGELGLNQALSLGTGSLWIKDGWDDDCRGKCSHLQGAQGVIDIGGGNPIAGDAGLTTVEDGFQNDAIRDSILDACDDSMPMISVTLMVFGGLRALKPRVSIEMDVSMKAAADIVHGCGSSDLNGGRRWVL
ncbi:hypothetical protein NE237_011163 [Protea cynaroides]|uniref:Neprosin PEP catalytic domain-containing protein n=1 Tax=Protea cynaroides TaxID=273540 RepID=A0A9Q0JXP4_9MAGN|nr:hypothetical protein NE237_011163 [Protea cynaroides]